VSGITFESTSRLVKAGDVTLHLNEVGDGPPLVLLHGSGPGATSWSNFKQNLPALSQHFRVLAVDQPGYGKSDKPPFSREDSIFQVTSRALVGLFDELGIEQAHILGNSLGGANALRFAIDHPERVSRMVLMVPGARPSTSSPRPSAKVSSCCGPSSEPTTRPATNSRRSSGSWSSIRIS
jgi:pimeloyl-ACP methyl ester carboxylesterase